jgi:hypothetical protein
MGRVRWGDQRGSVVREEYELVEEEDKEEKGGMRPTVCMYGDGESCRRTDVN